jgi:ribonuclease HI
MTCNKEQSVMGERNPRVVQVWTDGSACPRTNRTAIGIVIDTGQRRQEICRASGSGTSFEAEFFAIAEAARRLRKIDCVRTVIHSDCKSLVGQLNFFMANPDSGKVRRKLKRLRQLARRLQSMDCEVVVLHVPRNRNAEANRLARSALNRARRKFDDALRRCREPGRGLSTIAV